MQYSHTKLTLSSKTILPHASFINSTKVMIRPSTSCIATYFFPRNINPGNPNSRLVLSLILFTMFHVYAYHSNKFYNFQACLFKLFLIFIFIYRLMVKRCMIRQEEEKQLSYHQGAYQSFNLILNAASMTGPSFLSFLDL